MSNLANIANEIVKEIKFSKNITPELPLELQIAKVLLVTMRSGVNIDNASINALIEEIVKIKGN